MEKFISKTTKEFFYDEKGHLIKEVETIEEYKTNESDSDTTVNNISVKIHVDEDKAKESTIKSGKVYSPSITEDEINPNSKKIIDQMKEWGKTTGVPPYQYQSPFFYDSFLHSIKGNEGVLVLNDASLDELIGSAIRRIEKQLAQESKKNPKL